MIEEISANDATGSSGLAAKDWRRVGVRRPLVLPADLAEVGDLRELGPATWAFHSVVLLATGRVGARRLCTVPGPRHPARPGARGVCQPGVSPGVSSRPQPRDLLLGGRRRPPSLSITRSATASRSSRPACAATRDRASASSSPLRVAQPAQLGRGLDVDHDAEVEAPGLAGLDQQRDHVHHDGVGRRRRPRARRRGPDRGMDDPLEVPAGRGVGEDDPAQRRPVQPVARRATSGPNRSTTAASPGVPGRDHLAGQHVGVDDHRPAGPPARRRPCSCPRRSRRSDPPAAWRQPRQVGVAGPGTARGPPTGRWEGLVVELSAVLDRGPAQPAVVPQSRRR